MWVPEACAVTMHVRLVLSFEPATLPLCPGFDDECTCANRSGTWLDHIPQVGHGVIPICTGPRSLVVVSTFTCGMINLVPLSSQGHAHERGELFRMAWDWLAPSPPGGLGCIGILPANTIDPMAVGSQPKLSLPLPGPQVRHHKPARHPAWETSHAATPVMCCRTT